MRKVIQLALAILLAVNVLYAISGVLNFPMQSMDSIGIWMLKAKAISLGPAAVQKVMYAPVFMYSHPHYPLLLPLMFSLMGTANNTFHELPGLLLAPCMYCLVLLACYKTLRLRFPVAFSLVLTYIFSMFGPLLSQAGRVNAGNADIYICLLVWLCLYVQLRFPNSMKSLVLSAVGIAIASQIKMEGVFFVSLLLLQPVPLRRKGIPALIAITPTLVWMGVVRFNHIIASPGMSLPIMSTLVPNIAIVLIGTLRELLNFNNWYLFWPVFGVLLLQTKKEFFIQHKRILLVILMIYGGYVLTYLLSASSIDINGYVGASMDRLLLQFSPLFFILFAELMYAWVNALMPNRPNMF